MGVPVCLQMEPTNVLMNCGSTALVNALRYKGVPYPHLLLGDDNAAFYIEHDQVGYIVASYRYRFEEQLARYGVLHHAYEGCDPEVVWETICTEISRGNPLLFHCNTTHLPYFPTYNLPHVTVVKGFEPEYRTIWLCDATCSGPDHVTWAQFLLAITLEDDMARLAGTKGRFKWGMVDATHANPVSVPQLMASLQQNLRLLCHGVPWEEVEQRRLLHLWEMPVDSHVRVGWEAIEAYAEVCAQHLDGASPQVLERTELLIWDFWQQRRILVEILLHLANQTEQGAFSDAALLLQEAIQSWVVLRGLLAKQRLRPHPGNLLAFARRLRQVQTEEQQALAPLQAMI